MKTIEEKARAYDSIIEKANKMHSENCEACKACIEELIPELAESEDEKMMKEIIELVMQPIWKTEKEFHRRHELCAWLKKQVEHANFLSKIQVGDKVTRNEAGVLVNLSQLNRVAKKNEKQASYTTIAETGNGGINTLVTLPIEMKTAEESLGIDSDTYNKIVDECIFGGQKPADTVEPKFKVGDKIYLKPEYRMPNDDTPIANTVKEIRRIDDKHYRFDGAYIFIEDQDKYELVEQNLAENAKPQSSTPMSYGKELEKRMCEACNRFFAPNTDSNRYSASDLFYAGVKAERDLNTLAWSEEDEPQKELAESYLAKFDKKFPILPTLKGKQLADYKNFLNKCQQIFRLKYWGVHPRQAKLFEKLSLLWAAWDAEHLQGLGQTYGDMDDEISMWSEEDEENMKKILDAIGSYYYLTTDDDILCNWLKSIKDRVQPQNTWKPSDEQMEILLQAVAYFGVSWVNKDYLALQSLYFDLKKLKEKV